MSVRRDEPPAIYEIQVAPPRLVKVHLGDPDSLNRYVRTRGDVVAVIWNENGALNIGNRWERSRVFKGWDGGASTRPMNPAG